MMSSSRFTTLYCVLFSFGTRCAIATSVQGSRNADTGVKSRSLLRVEAQSDEKTEWVYCASQFQQCECPGAIRWGSPRSWKQLEPQSKPVTCSPFTLGDPSPGDATKHCECSVARGSVFYDTVSPAALVAMGTPVAEKPIVSCDSFEAGTVLGPWAAAQWEAVKGMCSTGESSLMEVGISAGGATSVESSSAAGARAMSPSSMRGLMRAWLDPRFRSNYDRIYDAATGNSSSRWVDEAFVNFVGNSPGGQRYAKINEQLIRSVHSFSTRPIVVVHFGMKAPPEWDPHRFPRLVLLHAPPLVSDRSFNFNKYRAMLLAQARNAVLLDSDQFVAPGVDAIFKRTREEVSKEYPFPILPVHFLTDKTAGTSGDWGQRFCEPDGTCPRQTMRWGHGHPTYTYHALPFLGRWLRRNFRDETLPAKAGGTPVRALRVVDVPEDEDLLNVGLWEEGAKKQWCKFDNTDPSDFRLLLNANPKTWTCGEGGCGDVGVGGADHFYPIGSPHVFYTAHHAVDPMASEAYITKLEARQKKGDLPPPILFKGKFTDDPQQLLRDYPQIGCLM